MKRYFTLLLHLICPILLFSQQIPKEPYANWVNKVTPETDHALENQGAYQYLLIDYQDNLKTKEQYAHYAVRVLNSEGIQEFSDISVSYDPTFQKLTFHQILVTRGNQKINKLVASEINVYQRESNLERALYDGSLTAVVNLTDIRKGDIIEYAYTVKGFNPINKGNYAATLYQQYTSPVSKIYNRLITSAELPVYYKLIDGAAEPQIQKTDGGFDYVWANNGNDYFQYDINVPYWSNSQKRISISTFKDWKAVVALSIPLYQHSVGQLNLPQELLNEDLNKEEKILRLIRFVQDEVRYLGFESGIGAYKPNPPHKVLHQRYGDCKDKSLLLVSLLRKENIEASPFLVNTETRDLINQLQPSHNLFNHCIVQFDFQGESYFIDPTITGQGGDLRHLSFPKYGAGLKIKRGVNDLTKIEETKILPKVKIEETITTDEIGGSAIFLIKSTYSGSRANQMRDYFKSNTQENINNEFVNYYSSLYPSITLSQPVRFTDNARNGNNKVIIEEYYDINNFWEKNEETGLFTCNSEPLILESMIEYSKSPERSMPYYLGEPFLFEQKTTIALPEYWNIKTIDFKVEKDAFDYNRKVKSVGKTVKIEHSYSLKKNILPATKVPEFLKLHQKINGQISYQLSHTGTNDEVSSNGINIISMIMMLVIIGLSIFLAKIIYEKYNPKAELNSSYKRKAIGGWLVLPGIGLVLTPFVLIIQIAQTGYFTEGIWTAFFDADYENAMALTIAMAVEFIYNLSLLIFTILLIILYFKRRTSFPQLIVIFYTLNVLIPLVELIFIQPIIPEELSVELTDYREIAKAVIGAAIWIPYFKISERVKDTFYNTYQENYQLTEH